MGRVRLTPAQEKYCKERAKGNGVKESYALAYPDAGEKGVRTKGYNLEKDELIKQRIERLQARADAGLIVSIEGSKAMLSEMVSDTDRPDAIRLKANDQLVRMMGGYRDTPIVQVNSLQQIVQGDVSGGNDDVILDQN